MKKSIYDYRGLRPNNLTSPKYRHIFLLLGWVFYFSAYALTENLIPEEACTPIYCPVDDWIPFCEWFIVPYFLWYALVAGSLLYFFLYNVDSFKRLQTYIIITQVAAMAIYVLLPSRQDLRPEVLPRDNVFSDIVAFLYRLDTNTNVCPSLHVAYSLGIASVWVKEKGISLWVKAGIVVFVVLVCLSTVFLKQHSVLDGLAAVPICLAAEWILFRDYRKEKKLQRSQC